MQLAALGKQHSHLPATCLRTDTAALETEKSRAAQLDDELARLWQQLQERAALCKPVIPPVAAKEPEKPVKKNDLTFLEGCWTSETGLYSHPSNEPIIAEYCFDKNGKGRRFVRERNGQVCSGSASARFQGNRLLFDSDPARCPRGGTYVPQKVECTGSESSTQCKGNELGGARHKWDARFRRK